MAITPPPAAIRGFPSAAAFETWLAANHDRRTELYLRIYKKSSGTPTVTYAEALDVALCWGWIDGLKKSYDAQSFLQRFTPRGKKSLWSEINREHIARLTAAGRMTPHGQRHVDAARADGRWEAAYSRAKDMATPPELLAAIRKVPAALATYARLDRVNLYALAWRVTTLKTAAGRAKKIEATVAMLARGETPHPMASKPEPEPSAKPKPIARPKPSAGPKPIARQRPEPSAKAPVGEPMVAFLRGVNLGKRTVRSAELAAAFVAMGYPDARTLIASGNVRFTARPSGDLATRLETGLAAQFGFPIAVVLRTRAELSAMIASAPFAGVALPATARPHGVLFAGPCPREPPLVSVAGDFDVIRVDARELYIVAWAQPAGGLGKAVTKLLAALAKREVSTARAWTTLVKAAAP